MLGQLVGFLVKLKLPVLIKLNKMAEYKWIYKINTFMNIDPKIANKILKCSRKQYLNVSSIFHMVINI